MLPLRLLARSPLAEPVLYVVLLFIEMVVATWVVVMLLRFVLFHVVWVVAVFLLLCLVECVLVTWFLGDE